MAEVKDLSWMSNKDFDSFLRHGSTVPKPPQPLEGHTITVVADEDKDVEYDEPAQIPVVVKFGEQAIDPIGPQHFASDMARGACWCGANMFEVYVSSNGIDIRCTKCRYVFRVGEKA